MDLPKGFKMKTAEGNTDLSLPAESNESFHVVGIYIHNPSDNFIEVETENTLVGYFRVGGTQGNQLFFPPQDAQVGNLLDFLWTNGLHRGFPVGAGETFTITGAAQADAIQTVIYREGDSGQFQNSQPNGSASQENDFMVYGRISGGAGAGYNLYDFRKGPVGYPIFPFEDDAPRNKQVTLKAVTASDVGLTSSSQSNQQETAHLRFVVNRTQLYEDEDDSIPHRGVADSSSDVTQVGNGYSLFSARSDEDYDEPTVLSDKPQFTGGDTFNLWLDTEVVAGSANFSEGDAEVGLLLTHRTNR